MLTFLFWLVVLWVASGILAYGITMAYFWHSFPIPVIPPSPVAMLGRACPHADLARRRR